MSAAAIEAEIHASMEHLTAAEKRAARALLANYPVIGLAPLSEFAEAAGASAATVLRFVARLGYESYPDFQRRLREELDERMKSPLEKSQRPEPARSDKAKFLNAYFARIEDNLRETLGRIPASEFEAACQHLGDLRKSCHAVGGRFTDAIASYLVAHLQIVRPGVRKLDGRPATRIDQLSDIEAGDIVILFDVRRYDRELARTAAALANRRATIILVTDFWISPISRYAKIVLPCQIDVRRTWDSDAALFALSEAIVARVTETTWKTARPRIEAIESAPREPE